MQILCTRPNVWNKGDEEIPSDRYKLVPHVKGRGSGMHMQISREENRFVHCDRSLTRPVECCHAVLSIC